MDADTEPLTVRAAVDRGHAWITRPVLVIMAVVAASGIVLVAAFEQILFGVLVIGSSPFVAWIWWSFMTPRWRYWALRRGVDPTDLQRLAQKENILWPPGHKWGRTEFPYRPLKEFVAQHHETFDAMSEKLRGAPGPTFNGRPYPAPVRPQTLARVLRDLFVTTLVFGIIWTVRSYLEHDPSLIALGVWTGVMVGTINVALAYRRLPLADRLPPVHAIGLGMLNIGLIVTAVLAKRESGSFDGVLWALVALIALAPVYLVIAGSRQLRR